MRKFVGRLDRIVGRFNKWFSPAAIAASAHKGGKAGGVKPTHAVAILGELEKTDASHRHGKDGPPERADT